MRIDNLLTPANYAKRINVSRQMVYKDITAGKVPTVKIDGVLFVKIGSR